MLPKPTSTGTNSSIIWAIDFSINGKYLAAGDYNRIVRV